VSLREDILNCKACNLWDAFKQTVPFEGNPEAEMMFIGRDPGREEVAQLRPFIGPAGQLFRREVLASLSIPESEVYISNIVCCRPVNNIAPARGQSWPCANRHVARAVNEVNPKVIVTLGKEAVEYALGMAIATMGGTRGGLYKFRGTQIPLIPTWHPSYVLRLQSINPVEAEFRRGQMAADIMKALEYCTKLKSMV
jgi:uracil-DNA glycosylase family 4